MHDKNAAGVTRREALRQIGIATAAAGAVGAGLDELVTLGRPAI